MKRQQFHITSTAGHNVIKFKWNSSIREIERLVKELAVNDKATYSLTNSESIKDGFSHAMGLREWTRQDGLVVKFMVSKI